MTATLEETPGKHDERHLLAFLEDRDVACPMCGYNLRNLTRAECPECHEELFLAVGAHRSKFGWLIVTIAPSIFSGIAAILLAIPLLTIPVVGGPSAPLMIVVVDLFGWLSGAAGLALFAARAQFMRLPVSTQRWAAAGTWVLHFGVFVAFILSML